MYIQALRIAVAPPSCPGAIYRRVNLRGMTWRELLAETPPGLWPLVALTRDGANVAAVEAARKAIEEHSGWSRRDRGDQLAVLWFVVEAEGVPGRLLFMVLSQEKLMESELYRAIFSDGRAEGWTEGEATAQPRASWRSSSRGASP